MSTPTGPTEQPVLPTPSAEQPIPQSDIAAVGERWKGWGTIASAAIALVALFLGGGFFYNNIILSKDLRYTLLPTYDLGSQSFAGLVIENRGGATLTELAIYMLTAGPVTLEEKKTFFVSSAETVGISSAASSAGTFGGSDNLW